MTGFLITAQGETWQLPKLLSWRITRTDGESADEAQVTFLYEPARIQVLKGATRLRLTEDKTVFFGVVDEITAKTGQEGRIVTLCSRSLQALLMDNELQAARYETLQAEDAIRQFVTPFGVERVRKISMPAVHRFAVETGNTAWQALRGFCRHSGQGYAPCFSADGELLFSPEKEERRSLDAQNKVLQAEVRLCRYGVSSKHIIVSAGYQQVELCESQALMDKGIRSQRVTLKQNTWLKADWRTAEQRLREDADRAVRITVELQGDYTALPGDWVQADLPACGVVGCFRLCSITRSQSNAGRRTSLTLKGEL